jgi:hypothetical protein
MRPRCDDPEALGGYGCPDLATDVPRDSEFE